MDDRQLAAALDRLDRALGRAEETLGSKLAALTAAAAGAAQAAQQEAASKAAELAALEARHAELKRAVAGGLRQLDEILAGMSK